VHWNKITALKQGIELISVPVRNENIYSGTSPGAKLTFFR